MFLNPRQAAVIAALLVWSADAAAVHKSPTQAAARSPVQVVATFYQWYVAKYRSDHDPMLELREGAAGRLSPALLDELDSQRIDTPPDRDYFLQADDVVRPCRSLDAALLGTVADTAQVGVTLAGRKVASWQVRVSLSRQGGAWRIREVVRDPRRPPASATARARSDC